MLVRLLIVALFFTASAAAQEKIDTLRSPIDPKTLRSYLTAMLRARQKGETQNLEALTEGLRLPNEEQWFVENLGPDQAGRLTSDYDRTFRAFHDRLVRNFDLAADDSKAEISLEERNKPPQGVSPSPSAPVPRAPLVIKIFKFVLRSRGKEKSEWMDSFVLVDDRLRFIGQGAFPFWASPLSMRVKKAR